MTTEGRSVIFISHRMDEIQEISDRVTVLRSGRSVATLGRREASTEEIVRLMSGAEHLVDEATTDGIATTKAAGDVVLRARGVRLRPGAALVDFAVRAGELVGLAGLEGHGQEAFLKALAGGAPEGETVREGDGDETILRSAQQAAALGVAYVPRDRRSESISPSLSIRENFAAPTLGADRRAGLLHRSRTRGRGAGTASGSG